MAREISIGTRFTVVIIFLGISLAGVMAVMNREAGDRDMSQVNLWFGLVLLVNLLLLVWMAADLTKNFRKCLSLARAVASSGPASGDHADGAGFAALAGTLERAAACVREGLARAEAQVQAAEAETDKARQARTQAAEAQGASEQAVAANVRRAAGELQTLLGRIAKASRALDELLEQASHGAGEQMQRMGETAVAMEEMSSTIIEIARNTSKAAEMADQAKTRASTGSEVVTKVVEGVWSVQDQAKSIKEDMQTLGSQTGKISQILNVISDIADQTNLLALNAAIEAARAGDAGRGFAVVADEVRKLAEKTMTATKEVGEAIHAIQTHTRTNVDGVAEAAAKIDAVTDGANNSLYHLKKIVAHVDATTDEIRSIATATEEQSAASEEINKSISSTNTLISETVEAVRKSVEAVQDIRKDVDALQESIALMPQKALAHAEPGDPRPGRANI